jgi:mannose-6-phosphate isomerase-like protein (cupin superfamily)
MITSRQNAQHYNWGDGCDGWVLLPNKDLTVIEERMPPGTFEIPHHHERARQLFYVLEGEFVMELAGERFLLAPGDSIEVAPGIRHQARNDGDVDVRFIVASSPTTYGDRVE